MDSENREERELELLECADWVSNVRVVEVLEVEECFLSVKVVDQIEIEDPFLERVEVVEEIVDHAIDMATGGFLNPVTWFKWAYKLNRWLKT